MPHRTLAGVRRGRSGRLVRRTLAQKAKATLTRVQFASGFRVGGMELSPRLTRSERRALAFWIRRLPAALAARLPELKLAVADRLHFVRANIFINEIPREGDRPLQNHTHAVSFIPQRYVVFHRELFRRRVELGRILYHELCHFLWPRLGNPGRRSYQTLLQQEFQQGARGELGYSSERRKEKLRSGGEAPRGPLGGRGPWRDYVCESFCDTGAFVLQGPERRANHSEYTLSREARQRRCRQWSLLVLGSERIPAGKGREPESPER